MFTQLYHSPNFLDWTAFSLFVIIVFSYRTFLAWMLRNRKKKLILGKLQIYRNAWIMAHTDEKSNLVVVQTLRNTIMSASFLASTAIILIMGVFNLLSFINGHQQSRVVIGIFKSVDPVVEMWRVFLIVITLIYTFINFTWYIRDMNYIGFILNIPKEDLDFIEGRDSTEMISNRFLKAGLRFSMGMRGYYFLMPLFLWLIHPVFMIGALLMVVVILLNRDLAG